MSLFTSTRIFSVCLKKTPNSSLVLIQCLFMGSGIKSINYLYQLFYEKRSLLWHLFFFELINAWVYKLTFKVLILHGKVFLYLNKSFGSVCLFYFFSILFSIFYFSKIFFKLWNTIHVKDIKIFLEMKTLLCAWTISKSPWRWKTKVNWVYKKLF